MTISSASGQQDTKVIRFALKQSEHQYRLMECPDSMLEGEPMYLRGQEGDGACLCTDTKTYRIRDRLTSNTLLLIDGVTDKIQDQL